MLKERELKKTWKKTVARRPNTGGITQIGEFMVNNSLPMAPPPPIRRLPPPSIRELPPTRGRSGGNDGYIIGPTDQVYNYSDLPKLKAQVAQNPMMARMLGDIISRLEAKDFDGTGDPLGDRGVGRRPPSIEQKRPPSIEEQVAQVLSGPSFPGKQTSKFPEQPMQMPEPVGPITDTKTMPSMPVAPVPSPMSVPPIAIEDPDIQKVVDALPKGTQRPVQPPVIPPTMTMPPIMETPPQTEVKLPDGTVIDLSDLMPQPEEESIPFDLPPDPIADGIFPGAEPKDLVPKFPDEGWPDIFDDTRIRSCPSPEEHIQLANNDWILAGELKVGDEVVTSEEPQKVTYAKIIEDSPRREVLFTEGDSIVTSPSHPYFVKDKGFVDVEDLKEGDVVGDLIVSEIKPFSDGPVIHISVDKAQTYMLRGGTEENPVPALSHNKSPIWPPDPPMPPDTPVTPPGTGGAPPGFIPPPADSTNTMAFVDYYNPTTGETWSAPSGGWTAPPGWEVKPSPSFPTTPPPPPVDPTTPPPPVDPTPPVTETTPVQGMTMEQMQQMIADMQAQQQEQAAARAAQEKEMSKQYMVYGDRTGYNPYQSGQYQSDPYGPSGVPNMGGITTIPVPGGYGIYNPVYGR